MNLDNLKKLDGVLDILRSFLESAVAFVQSVFESTGIPDGDIAQALVFLLAAVGAGFLLCKIVKILIQVLTCLSVIVILGLLLFGFRHIFQ